MKFQEGMIMERKWFGETEVIFRFPKKTDAREAMEYINSLIAEKARITLVKKVSLELEKTWLEKRLRDVKKGMNLTVFAEIGGKIAGAADLHREMDPPSAMDHVGVLGFGVSKTYRRKGIAQEMVELLLRLAKQRGDLEIVQSSYMSDNEASAALHKKLGFRVVGRIPRGAKYGKKFVDRILTVKEL